MFHIFNQVVAAIVIAIGPLRFVISSPIIPVILIICVEKGEEQNIRERERESMKYIELALLGGSKTSKDLSPFYCPCKFQLKGI